MNNILHISANQFDDIESAGHTYRIWAELSLDYDNYYILARSKSNNFRKFSKGNITLLLIPYIIRSSSVFVISSIIIFYYVKRYNINRLIAQDALAGGLMGILASKFYKIPVLVEIHADIYFDYFKEKNMIQYIFSKLSKWIFRNATKVRSLSTEMTVLLRNAVDLSNVVLIPNRVNMSLFYPPKSDYSIGNKVVITSIGRFVEQKGYESLIEVVNKLYPEYPIELVLVGGGKLRLLYEKLIGDNANIKLIDWINQDELVDILRRSDIYVQPSIPYRGEAMPRTILEAMAIGLPIVATDVCAIPGVLNSNNSILISANSPSQLEYSLLSLIQNFEIRQQLGQRAFTDVRDNFSWKEMFQIYRRELRDLNNISA